jgi:hypothetical protein
MLTYASADSASHFPHLTCGREFKYLKKGVTGMSAQLDSLIRKSKDFERQIEQLTAELARLHGEIAERMGDRHEYYGHGVVAKKWARVHWEIDKDLLLDELSYEALDYCKEVILTKTKLDQAVKAGYLPPRLYDRAVKREQLGWNVSLKILEPLESALEWEREEER